MTVVSVMKEEYKEVVIMKHQQEDLPGRGAKIREVFPDEELSGV